MTEKNAIKPTLLILAAGMGSRYGSLKQIDQLGPSGETIIDYSVYDAMQCGFGKLVFVIRKNIEKEFKEVFLKKYEGKIEIDYVFQAPDNLPEGFTPPKDRQKPWGTVHAVLMAKDKIKEPFLVINGDDFYGRDAFRVCADFLQNLTSDTDYCMPSYLLNQTLSDNGSVSRGICQLKNDYLQSIVERKNIFSDKDGIYFLDENNQRHALAGEECCSMNMFGFTPSVFQFLEKGFAQFLKENINHPTAELVIPVIINDLLLSGEARVKVLPNQSQWFGVTYKADKPISVNKIKALVEAGVYPKCL